MLRAVWRHRWRVLTGTALMTGVFFVRAHTQPDIYAAEARITVVPGRVAGGEGDRGGDVRRLALSAAELATSDEVARAAADTAALSSPAEVRDRASARAVADAGTVIVTGRAGTAADSAVLAGAVAEAIVEAVRADQTQARAEARERADREIEAVTQQIDNPLVSESERAALAARRDALVSQSARAQLLPVDRARITSPARAGLRPVSPRPVHDAAVAAALALLANAGLALAAERFSDRFPADRVADEVAALTGLPVLAVVPAGTGPEMVDGIRALRTSLMFVTTPERLRTLAVVSAERGSGRSFVSLHLAREAAALGVSVVLVDADLRHPSLHESLGVAREPGLVDALEQHRGLDEVGVEVDRDLAVRFVPAGRAVEDPSALLGAGPIGDLMDKLTWAELVVVDTPAGLTTGDALSVAARCDATVVVVDAEVSRRRQVLRLVNALRPTDAHLLGAVVNRV